MDGSFDSLKKKKQQKAHPCQAVCCKLSSTCIQHDILYTRDTHGRTFLPTNSFIAM
jgi:hypothetical protein